MGYQQQLPMQAAPLVDRLLDQLLKTTQRYTNLSKKMAKIQDCNYQHLIHVNKQLEKQAQKKDNIIQELRSKRDSAERKIGVAPNKQEILRLQKLLQEKENQIQNLQKKLAIIQQYQQRFEEQQQQILLLQAQKQGYGKKLISLQDQLDFMATTKQHFPNEVKREKQKDLGQISKLREDIRFKSRQIEQLLGKLNISKQTQLDCQQQLRQLSLKIEHLSHQNIRLQEDKSELQTILSGKSKTLRQNQRHLNQLQLQLNQVRTYRQKYQQLLTKMSQNNSSEQHQSLSQNNKIKYLQKEISNLSQQLKQIVRQNQGLRQQNHKLTEENLQMKLIIENGSRQLQVIQHQKETLLQEIKLLRNKPVPVMQDKVAQKMQNVLAEEARTLKRMLDSQKQGSQDLKRNLKELTASNTKLQLDYQNQHQKRNQLERYLQKIQQINKDATQKIRDQIRLNEDLQRNTALMREELQILKTQNRQLNKDLDLKSQSLMAVDQERCQILDKADQKTQQNQKLIQKCRQLIQENSQLRQMLTANQYRVEDLWRKLQRMQTLSAQFQNKKQTLFSQKQFYRSSVSQKQREIMQLMSDMNLRTREIQQLRTAVQSLEIDRERLKLSMHNYMQSQKQSALQGRAKQMQRSDLLSQIQTLRFNNQQLDRDNAELDIQNTKIGKRMQSLQSQNQYLQSVIIQHQCKQNDYNQNIGQLDRRLSRVALKCQELDKLNKSLAEDKKRVSDELQSLRRIINAREKPVEKSNNGQVLQLQGTVDWLKSQLEIERSNSQVFKEKALQLQQVIKTQRLKQTQMSRTIQRLRLQLSRGKEKPEQRDERNNRGSVLEESSNGGSQNSQMLDERIKYFQRQYQKAMQIGKRRL